MAKKTLGLTPIPLTRVELNKIKVRAIRRGLWFKLLSRVERASVDLTLKVVKRVRSHLLAKVLTSIVKKLLEAMESKVACMMKKVGINLAQKLSRIALNWGNKFAVHWAEDPSFMQFLTVTYMNTPAMFKG